jgi:Zn-dependent protease
MGQLPNVIYLASIWVIPLVIAITFHEAAHGFVARFLGDETAWRLGRVSLNPLKHIDPPGTVLLPGLLLLLGSPFLFGYAKPVPVNFQALRNPRSGMVWVAVAGPAMNIALAILAALAFHLVGYPSCDCGAMGRGELKERADHQCRVGRVQLISDSST